MGRKKYFCDFCNRFFNDDKNTRQKHLNSVNHLNMKKEHYNMFRDLSSAKLARLKGLGVQRSCNNCTILFEFNPVESSDPETILQEESSKKPCRKFHYEGYCPFGGHCTFTHYSKQDLDAIRLELFTKEQQQKWNQPTIESWLLKYNQEVEEKNKKSQRLLWSCELPPELLPSAGLLPPSLQPFHIQEFMNADLESWG